MTEKHRQAQLFAGPVTFDHDVAFRGSVTVRSVSTELGSVAAGLVVAIEPGAGPVVADSSNPEHADRIVGISLGSGRVATAGELGGISGVQAGDVLYLSGVGGLSATPPSSGFQQRVAVATSSADVVVSPGTAILI